MSSRLKLKDAQGNLRHWWSALTAVPRNPKEWPYRRLRRVWFDHTWSGHPFLEPLAEIHLTATLWENFVLFEPSGWVPALLELAGLQDLVEAVVDVNWGYEIHGISQKKYADVAVHVRDAEGDAVVLVEAKRRGGKLKRDDRHPGSYLDLEAFSWTDRRALIYLVDKRDRAGVVKQVVDPGGRSGIVTWQALGGLQVRLTRSLRADSQIQDFIAGAIQYQYLQHEIVPDSLAFDYLAEELTREEIRADSRIKQTASDVLQQEWRLGGRDPKCR